MIKLYVDVKQEKLNDVKKHFGEKWDEILDLNYYKQVLSRAHTLGGPSTPDGHGEPLARE